MKSIMNKTLSRTTKFQMIGTNNIEEYNVLSRSGSLWIDRKRVDVCEYVWKCFPQRDIFFNAIQERICYTDKEAILLM